MRTALSIRTSIVCISLLTLSALILTLPVAETQLSLSPAPMTYLVSRVGYTPLSCIPTLPSFHPGYGPIIWDTIIPAMNTAVSIGNNGTQIFAGSIQIAYNLSVCFQLYSTQGTGQALWQYTVPETWYVQVDAAKERDLIVGLAMNNPQRQPPVQRLYQWTSASSTPNWYYDIPLRYQFYLGGLIQHNLALSCDGTRVILATSNSTNRIIQIFQFDADTGTLLGSYTIHLGAEGQAFVGTLDVSTDGSLVLVTNDLNAFLVNMTTQTIRWTSDNAFGLISGDGSILANRAWDDGYVLIVQEWNATDQQYHERWRQRFTDSYWAYLANLHCADISEDGSTIIISVLGNRTSPPFLQTKTVLFDSHSGRLWENNTQGHGTLSDGTTDAYLSATGSRAIVASFGDELGSVDQLRVFDRDSSHPRFSVHAPGSMVSAGITRDGAFAAAAATNGQYFGNYSIIYSLNASGLEPIRNLSETFHGGKLFNVLIKNDDNMTATDIPWTMYNIGGIFHHVSYHAFGSVPSVLSHETVTVSSERLTGFGRINAYVTIDHTWYQLSGWIIGRYIFLTSPRNVI
jgi:hypothetical protein